ncbi:uncharacterized protein LOC142221075 [Haematobia irritans]|uniref:uncharacterized protein LOC142221075 n=1 Tax=Haematobia irritans TaxID=7368 RepID=UPI003F5033C6
MRYALAFFLVACLVALTWAAPSKDKEAPACSKKCGESYEPVCAKAKNGNRERLLTFGSECVLGNYNCQHSDDPFEVKSRGECGGNVGVRLS